MPDLPRVLASSNKVVLLSLALIGVSVSQPASAQEFCSEPIPPYCVDKESDFDSALQVNRCEDDLTDYEEQLDEFQQCITKRIEGMREALRSARETLNEAKGQF